ncbi:MAG: STAS domain-containing protein [Candidatus Eremiobacteraeota bacterium]|nr:STAS domain-containing protein [Candidatus Eremiobacteraeota bacterium]MBV8354451.1 STAS domain-containing protein [Candidatus Eremiobacteraeota bacterium]
MSGVEPRLVKLSGELDLSRHREVQNVFAACPPDAPTVLIDLRNVAYLDSLAIAELVIFRRTAAGRGQRTAALIGNEQVRHILQLSGITEGIFTDEAAALASLSG